MLFVIHRANHPELTYRTLSVRERPQPLRVPTTDSIQVRLEWYF